jgi:hypothetical protein
MKEEISSIEEFLDKAIENIKPVNPGIGEQCEYHPEKEAIVWTGKGMLCAECVEKYYKQQKQ